MGQADYARSETLAKAPDGCSPLPGKQQYALYGIAHTHPHNSFFNQNGFSTDDYEGAIETKNKEPTLDSYYLYPPDRKVRRYRPHPSHWCPLNYCSGLDRTVVELP